MTGATRGIGEAIVHEVPRHGLRIIVAAREARDAPLGEKVARELAGGATFCALDVTARLVTRIDW